MQEVFEKIIEKLGDKIFSAELYGDEWNGQTVDNLLCLGDVKDVIQNVATECDNRWIPCSERLPEESLNSVIGWDEYRKRCCFVQYYAGQWQLAGKNKYGESVKIIAWQPLPEPYQPEGE